MHTNATLKPGSILISQDSPRTVTIVYPRRVYAKIILEDIFISEVVYKGNKYTTWTRNLRYDT